MKETNFIIDHRIQFLNYFRSRFPVFHDANLFYTDLRYAVKYFLNSAGFKPSDAELDEVLKALVKVMVSDGVLKQLSNGTWTLNYPEFRTKKPGKPVLKF